MPKPNKLKRSKPLQGKLLAVAGTDLVLRKGNMTFSVKTDVATLIFVDDAKATLAALLPGMHCSVTLVSGTNVAAYVLAHSEDDDGDEEKPTVPAKTKKLKKAKKSKIKKPKKTK